LKADQENMTQLKGFPAFKTSNAAPGLQGATTEDIGKI